MARAAPRRTRGGGIAVRRARADELPAVLDLLARGAARARKLGHPMWPRRFRAATIDGPRRRGELFIARSRGRIVGSFVLAREDPGTWGRSRVPARYLHRLVIAPDRAGEGLGEFLIAWAARAGARAGAELLRLDTVRSNPGLVRYYEGLGFARRGSRRRHGRWLLRFERPLRTRRSRPTRRAGSGAVRSRRRRG
jgi:GNAT superfamily N-acetyltransferase